LSLFDNLNAVLFDLGGTLIEFENQPWDGLERMGMRAAFDALNLESKIEVSASSFADGYVEFHKKKWIEIKKDNVEQSIESLCGEYLRGLGYDPGAGIREFVETFYRPISEQLRLIDGALELLTEVRARGLKIGLVSNSPFEGDQHRSEMSRFGILEYFDYTVFSSDFGMRKPNRSIFMDCVGKLGVAPSRSVHIGDRPTEDTIGAQACGIETVLIRRHDRVLPETIKPDYIVDRLEEILEL